MSERIKGSSLDIFKNPHAIMRLNEGAVENLFRDTEFETKSEVSSNGEILVHSREVEISIQGLTSRYKQTVLEHKSGRIDKIFVGSEKNGSQGNNTLSWQHDDKEYLSKYEKEKMIKAGTYRV